MYVAFVGKTSFPLMNAPYVSLKCAVLSVLLHLTRGAPMEASWRGHRDTDARRGVKIALNIF